MRTRFVALALLCGFCLFGAFAMTASAREDEPTKYRVLIVESGHFAKFSGGCTDNDCSKIAVLMLETPGSSWDFWIDPKGREKATAWNQEWWGKDFELRGWIPYPLTKQIKILYRINPIPNDDNYHYERVELQAIQIGQKLSLNLTEKSNQEVVGIIGRSRGRTVGKDNVTVDGNGSILLDGSDLWIESVLEVTFLTEKDSFWARNFMHQRPVASNWPGNLLPTGRSIQKIELSRQLKFVSDEVNSRQLVSGSVSLEGIDSGNTGNKWCGTTNFVVYLPRYPQNPNDSVKVEIGTVNEKVCE
jgi:hypothetical protein